MSFVFLNGGLEGGLVWVFFTFRRVVILYVHCRVGSFSTVPASVANTHV